MRRSPAICAVPVSAYQHLGLQVGEDCPPSAARLKIEPYGYFEDVTGMKSLPSALWLLPLLLLSQSPVSQAADDGIVVPGERIGAWTLAMTLADLIHANGPPDSWGRGFNPPRSNVKWENLSLYASSFDDKEIVDLSIGYNPSRRYQTVQGVGYGSSRYEMEKAHGIAPEVYRHPPRFEGRNNATYVYDAIGLAFALTECLNDPRSPPCITGTIRVTVVTVFRPGDAKRIWGDSLRPNG
jgi:hypothetical protein